MELRALTCDTYGTLVDWRGTILDELRAFGVARRLDRDWEAFLTDQSEWDVVATDMEALARALGA